MAKSREQDHPFYKPLWVRIAVVVVCAAWSAFEIYTGNSGMFTAIAVGALAYAIYTFFITWPKDGNAPPGDDASPKV